MDSVDLAEIRRRLDELEENMRIVVDSLSAISRGMRLREELLALQSDIEKRAN